MKQSLVYWATISRCGALRMEEKYFSALRTLERRGSYRSLGRIPGSPSVGLLWGLRRDRLSAAKVLGASHQGIERRSLEESFQYGIRAICRVRPRCPNTDFQGH